MENALQTGFAQISLAAPNFFGGGDRGREEALQHPQPTPPPRTLMSPNTRTLVMSLISTRFLSFHSPNSAYRDLWHVKFCHHLLHHLNWTR